MCPYTGMSSGAIQTTLPSFHVATGFPIRLWKSRAFLIELLTARSIALSSAISSVIVLGRARLLTLRLTLDRRPSLAVEDLVTASDTS